jgi:hypothetical protein
MISKQLIKVSAAVALALSFGGANAQLADAGAYGTSTNYGVNNGAASSTYSPGRNMTYNGGSQFRAFCIDPGTGTILPSAYSTMSLDSFLDGSATSGYQQQLTRAGSSYSTTWPGLSVTTATQTIVRNDLKELFSYAYNDALTSATKTAAFGMAVWEIILQDGTNGTTYARTSGRLTSYGSTAANDNDVVEQQTNSYLSALNTGNWSGLGLATATNWNYTVYFDSTSPFSQTFLAVTTPGVPEPGTAALAALALFGAVRFSRGSKKA